MVVGEIYNNTPDSILKVVCFICIHFIWRFVVHTQKQLPTLLGISYSNESCLSDISGSKEIAQCEKGLETKKTIGVEISGTSQIVGKDSNLHIAELSAPASTLALKYVDAEVPQNCNKQD